MEIDHDPIFESIGTGLQYVTAALIVVCVAVQVGKHFGWW